MLNFEVGMGTFLLLILASFRLTRLIVFDKITEFIRSPFMEEISEIDENGREELFIVPKSKGIGKWIGELLSCYWCTGIWASAFLVFLQVFFPGIGQPLVVILAVAGAAAVIETVVSRMMGQ